VTPQLDLFLAGTIPLDNGCFQQSGLDALQIQRKPKAQKVLFCSLGRHRLWIADDIICCTHYAKKNVTKQSKIIILEISGFWKRGDTPISGEMRT